MSHSFHTLAGLAATICLALQSAPSTAQSAPAAASAAPAASTPAIRTEVATPLQAARAALSAGKPAEALVKLAEAEAVPSLVPYEQYLIERFRVPAAAGSGQAALAIKALDFSLASPFAQAGDALPLTQLLGTLLYQTKDYKRASATIRKYIELGGTDQPLRNLLGQALYLADDNAGAAKVLEAQWQADRAAARAPAELTLRMLASASIKVSDDAGYLRALEGLAQHYPRPEYWTELSVRVLRGPGFSDRLLVEVLRFQRAAGVLAGADAHLDLAQIGLNTGFPLEAQKVLAEGYAAGLLGKGPDADKHGKLRDQANRATAADKAGATEGENLAKVAREGDSLVNLGYLLALDGQLERGLSLAELGLARSSLRRPEEARLRLGIVQWMAGKRDAALQTFASVKGAEGAAELARLWQVFVRSPASQGRKAG